MILVNLTLVKDQRVVRAQPCAKAIRQVAIVFSQGIYLLLSGNNGG